MNASGQDESIKHGDVIVHCDAAVVFSLLQDMMVLNWNVVKAKTKQDEARPQREVSKQLLFICNSTENKSEQNHQNYPKYSHDYYRR